MATNPMQRKSKISFLLGVFLALFLSSLVVAFLLIQLKNYRDKELQELAEKVSVYVLNQNVASGQVLTADMLQKKDVNKNTVPSNAIGTDIISSFSLTDKAGNPVVAEYKNNEPILYLQKNGNKEIKTDETTGTYYIESNGEKEYVELVESPILAKIDLYKNSVVTLDMIVKSDEQTTDDLRKQEYNMLVLPSQLENNEYIDIRMALPTGEDYIVVSKKQVEIPEINGELSDDTIILNMSEGETLTMNNAIVDAYRIIGAKLYVTRYTEAGIQSAATPTYVPTQTVMQLINQNPNIVETAKNALIRRYNENNSMIRNEGINSAINSSGQEGEENLKTKIEESITNTKETRKQYLQSLGGTTAQ